MQLLLSAYRVKIPKWGEFMGTIIYRQHCSKRARILLKLLLAIAGVVFLVMLYGRTNRQQYQEAYADAYVRTDELPPLLDFYYYSRAEWKEKIADARLGRVVNGKVAKWLLEQTGCTAYINCDWKDTDVPDRDAWNRFYGQLLELLDSDRQITCTDEIVKQCKKKKIDCISGEYENDLDGFKTSAMTAVAFYRKGDTVIGVCRKQSREAKLCNVYLTDDKEQTLCFLYAGQSFEVARKTAEEQELKNRVCDLVWKDGILSSVQLKEDTITGNLIAVQEDAVEIEGYGRISRSVNLPVYKTYGTPEEKQLSDIVLANMKVEYVVAEDRVEAILLLEPAQMKNIRVLLLAGGSPYRKQVRFLCSTDSTLTRGEETTVIPAGTGVSEAELFGESAAERVRICPNDPAGEFTFLKEDGTQASLGYRGNFEVCRMPGGYAVVNELPVEEYLCAVVPGEMPQSFEMEALKAQAVCARSYACIQMENSRYPEFGAHVDDSVNDQVYNTKPRDEKTTAAVMDTAGLVILYQGKPAQAYYFSTSAGITGNGDAWHLDTDGSDGYLKSVRVNKTAEQADYSSDESFLAFLTQPQGQDYESGCPYYRWDAACDFSSDDVQKKIKKILKTRKTKTPEEITWYKKNGKETSKMKKFGRLLTIHVLKRSSSGVILQLQLDYENGTAVAGGEYTIRCIFGAGLENLQLQDQSVRQTELLPSAYCCITSWQDGICTLRGGGYGHGIGMSQNGAQAMAEEGKSYDTIIRFFFGDIEINPVS